MQVWIHFLIQVGVDFGSEKCHRFGFNFNVVTDLDLGFGFIFYYRLGWILDLRNLMCLGSDSGSFPNTGWVGFRIHYI